MSEMSEPDGLGHVGSPECPQFQTPPRPVRGERSVAYLRLGPGGEGSDERSNAMSEMSERALPLTPEEEAEAASAAWRKRFYAARAAACVPIQPPDRPLDPVPGARG